MTRVGAWIGILCCLASALIILLGALTVFHRQERCVQAVKLAQGAGLSTWEAIEKCGR